MPLSPYCHKVLKLYWHNHSEPIISTESCFLPFQVCLLFWFRLVYIYWQVTKKYFCGVYMSRRHHALSPLLHPAHAHQNSNHHHLHITTPVISHTLKDSLTVIVWSRIETNIHTHLLSRPIPWSFQFSSLVCRKIATGLFFSAPFS